MSDECLECRVNALISIIRSGIMAAARPPNGAERFLKKFIKRWKNCNAECRMIFIISKYLW